MVHGPAAVEAARGDLQNAVVSVPLTDESTRSLLEEANASLAATGHARQITEHDLGAAAQRSFGQAISGQGRSGGRAGGRVGPRPAKLDLDRARQLFKQELTARQDLDHADASFRSAAAMLDVARQRLAQAQDDARAAASAIRSQQRHGRPGGRAAWSSHARPWRTRRVSASKFGCVRPRSSGARAPALALAQSSAGAASMPNTRTSARATTGRVTKKAVEIGQVVPPGQPLLRWCDLGDQRDHCQLQGDGAQRGSGRVNRPPSKSHTAIRPSCSEARVDSIQGGSGRSSSLLPPENATGNYVKIVQRIPVKIVLAPGKRRTPSGARDVGRADDHLALAVESLEVLSSYGALDSAAGGQKFERLCCPRNPRLA